MQRNSRIVLVSNSTVFYTIVNTSLGEEWSEGGGRLLDTEACFMTHEYSRYKVYTSCKVNFTIIFPELLGEKNTGMMRAQ